MNKPDTSTDFTDRGLRALGGGATLGDVAVFFGASARLLTGLQLGVDSLTGLPQGSLEISELMKFFAGHYTELHQCQMESAQDQA